jgi:hypothetical protein
MDYVSFIIFGITSDLESESVFWFLLHNRYLLGLDFSLLDFRLFALFLIFIWIFNDSAVFVFLGLLFLLHFLIELDFVLLAVKDIFLLDFILHDEYLLNFFKELSLQLRNALLNSGTGTRKLLTDLFGELLSIDPKDIQPTNSRNVVLFPSVLRINNYIFLLDCLLFLVFLLFGCLLFLYLF